MARGVYYLVLGLSVVALKEAIHALRMVAGDPKAGGTRAEGLASEAGWALLLAGCVFALALVTYEELRSQGMLGRRSALFERILSRGDRSQQA
jgi:hypothetical protein